MPLVRSAGVSSVEPVVNPGVREARRQRLIRMTKEQIAGPYRTGTAGGPVPGRGRLAARAGARMPQAAAARPAGRRGRRSPRPPRTPLTLTSHSPRRPRPPWAANRHDGTWVWLYAARWNIDPVREAAPGA